jgi:Concanavalin A-like lectin/glucanases superfamily
MATASALLVSKPTITVPSAPTISYVYNIGTYINIGVNYPSNGGSPITGFLVTLNPGNYQYVYTEVWTYTSTTLTTGLILPRATMYTITIQAINSAGIGPAVTVNEFIDSVTDTVYTTTGSNTWTIPPYTSAISFVIVGGGGNTAPATPNVAYGGGAGGGLTYNQIFDPTPTHSGFVGSTINLYVGSGGQTSWFLAPSTYYASGGAAGTSISTPAANAVHGGGGGAAGYWGSGGNGAYGPGASFSTKTYGGGAGGGTNFSGGSGGQGGANPAAQSGVFTAYGATDVAPTAPPGTPVSGGGAGGFAAAGANSAGNGGGVGLWGWSNLDSTGVPTTLGGAPSLSPAPNVSAISNGGSGGTPATSTAPYGGLYGGGAGGGANRIGAPGAIRIITGRDRTFPSNYVGSGWHATAATINFVYPTSNGTVGVAFTRSPTSDRENVLFHNAFSVPGGYFGSSSGYGSGVVYISGLLPNVSYQFYVSGWNAFGRGAQSNFVSLSLPNPAGEAIYTTPGTYTFTVPNNVYYVNVLCIGGGGAGGSNGGGGGGGGGLAWKNNIPVVPGTTYTVVVGAGAKQKYLGSYNTDQAGGDSYFSNPAFIPSPFGANSYYYTNLNAKSFSSTKQVQIKDNWNYLQIGLGNAGVPSTFTIEFWIYFNSLPNTSNYIPFMKIVSAGGRGYAYDTYIYSSFYVQSGTGGLYITNYDLSQFTFINWGTNVVPKAKTWYHMHITGSGSYIYHGWNGQNYGSVQNPGSGGLPDQISIGGSWIYGYGGSSYSGSMYPTFNISNVNGSYTTDFLITNFRLSGSAVYGTTGSYAIPTSPLTATSSTYVLTCNTADFANYTGSNSLGVSIVPRVSDNNNVFNLPKMINQTQYYVRATGGGSGYDGSRFSVTQGGYAGSWFGDGGGNGAAGGNGLGTLAGGGGGGAGGYNGNAGSGGNTAVPDSLVVGRNQTYAIDFVNNYIFDNILFNGTTYTGSTAQLYMKNVDGSSVSSKFSTSSTVYLYNPQSGYTGSFTVSASDSNSITISDPGNLPNTSNLFVSASGSYIGSSGNLAQVASGAGSGGGGGQITNSITANMMGGAGGGTGIYGYSTDSAVGYVGTNSSSTSGSGGSSNLGNLSYKIPNPFTTTMLYANFRGTSEGTAAKDTWGYTYFTLPAAITTTAGYTIEWWIYFNTLNSSYNYYVMGAGFGGTTISISATGINIVSPGYTITQTSSFSFTTGKWYHIALMGSVTGGTPNSYIAVNGVVRSFLGGYLGASGYSSTDSLGQSFYFGCGEADGISYVYGGMGYMSFDFYVTNLRIVSGSMLYNTSGFTPPTNPLTAIPGTQLLTFNTNTIADNSGNYISITAATPDGTTTANIPFMTLNALSIPVNGGTAGSSISAGGNFGAGGGGGDFNTPVQGQGNGANGAVYITWGAGRAFPNNYTYQSNNIPAAPTIGTATAVSTGTATVTYKASAFARSEGVLNYTAVSNPGNITGTLTTNGSGTITVSGLTTGISYTFTVYASNALYQSQSSSASNSITSL